MDRFSPLAPAQIRVLVLPVGRIERTRFTNFVARLKDEASVVRLGDIAHHVANDDSLLSPKSFPAGTLMYSYHTSLPGEQEQSLSPFELFRETLLVLGVKDGAEEDLKNAEAPVQALEYIRERHPRVIHRHLLVLKDDALAGPPSGTGVTYVARTEDNQDLALHQSICQISASFLAELSTYTAAMQASPSIQTPGLFSRRHQPRPSLIDIEKRPASSMGFSSSNTAPTTPTDEKAPRFPRTMTGSPPTSSSLENVRNSDSIAHALSRTNSQSSNPSAQHARASSQDRMSLQGFGSHTSQEKMRHRGKARVGIVIGSLYMMAGQWPEAQRMLVEHTTKARAFSDGVWYGKGLENILACLLLQVQAGLDFQVPTICQQFAEKTSSLLRLSSELGSGLRSLDATHHTSSARLVGLIPEITSQILRLYSSGEGLLEISTLTLAEAVIRSCKLLASVQVCGGEISSKAFHDLLFATSSADLHRTLILPGYKTMISDMLSGVLAAQVGDLAVGDAIGVLGGIASVYELLGMERKKGVVMRDLVCRLTDALTEARKRGAAEMGIHPSASLSADADASAPFDVVSDRPGTHRLLSDVAQLHFVNIQDASNSLEASSHEHCGSDTIRHMVARDLLAFCEASPDPRDVSRMAAAMLSTAVPAGALDLIEGSDDRSISPDEQARLATAIDRALDVSRHMALPGVRATYWDQFIVRDVEFASPDPSRAVIELSKLQAEPTVKPDGVPGNPFLYDRNASRLESAIQATNYTLVQNEHSTCMVTLQNPTDVPIEVVRLGLIADDLDLQTSHHSIILRPRSLQQVPLSVVSHTVGDFKITGCRLEIRGCAEQDFPIIRKPWVPRPPAELKTIIRASSTLAQDPKYSWQASRPELSTASASVVPAMPVVEVQATSLTEADLMLLDGESRSVAVTLRNTSDITASVFNVTSLNEALVLDVGRSRTLSRNLTLEAPVEIGPDEAFTFDCQAIGRSGLDTAALSFYYSSKTLDTKHARSCSLPVKITVLPAIQLRNLDILAVEQDKVLLSFDAGNVWYQSIAYSCTFGESSGSASAQEGTLAPGEVKRIQLGFPRAALRKMFRDDAAIVSQALLDALVLQWRCGDRVGRADTSVLSLSPDAAEFLRGSPVEVTVTMASAEEASICAGNFTTIRVAISPASKSNHFAPLLVQLHARSAYGLKSPTDDGRLAITGSHQRIITAVSSTEDTTVDFVACVLLSGPLELVGAVRPVRVSADMNSDRSWQAVGSLVLDVG